MTCKMEDRKERGSAFKMWGRSEPLYDHMMISVAITSLSAHIAAKCVLLPSSSE